MRAPWLQELEDKLVGADAAIAVVTVASVAGRDVGFDEEELRASARRALFVLAAGGDPDRGLGLSGPAVTTFAADIDDNDRRAELARGLEQLRVDAVGLPHVSETVHALLDAPDTAWRAFACALLAEELAEG